MNATPAPSPTVPAAREAPAARPAAALSWRRATLFAGGAVAAFHLAYTVPALAVLIAVFLYCLFQLTALATPRQAFYAGLAVGYAAYAPHLAFFWDVFGWPAAVLWAVPAFWLGVFVALAQYWRQQLGRASVLLIPFLWTGIEYFRGELYYLRFSWLSAGYAFSDLPRVFSASRLGLYGVGFLLMLGAALVTPPARRRARLAAGLGLAAVAWLGGAPEGAGETPAGPGVRVAGVQLEGPSPIEVVASLNTLLKEHPDTDLVVLSEYTFGGPIPEPVRRWCRRNRKYLVAGGREDAPGGDFYNTAFVMDPNGEVVFRQVKSVPIQFFKDGLPAPEQGLWESPWGRFGIGICYDLSYRRVLDGLVGRGAQAILAPTMDVENWGAAQHRLHARVPPVRAAEYGVPVFRVCSSGISQLIESSGRVIASAPFPGQGEAIAGVLRPVARGRLPADHWLGPLSVAVTAAMLLGIPAKKLLERAS